MRWRVFSKREVQLAPQNITVPNLAFDVNLSGAAIVTNVRRYVTFANPDLWEGMAWFLRSRRTLNFLFDYPAVPPPITRYYE